MVLASCPNANGTRADGVVDGDGTYSGSRP